MCRIVTNNIDKNVRSGKTSNSDIHQNYKGFILANYLQKEEIQSLNRIITMYLDYAEDQAKRKIPMTMSEWSKS